MAASGGEKCHAGAETGAAAAAPRSPQAPACALAMVSPNLRSEQSSGGTRSATREPVPESVGERILNPVTLHAAPRYYKLR